MKAHRKLLRLCLGFACSSVATPAFADSEAPNVAHVATDEYGRCFAHSIPDDYYGTGGRTDIYVADKKLKRQHSYPWFAQRIYVLCNVSDAAGTIAPVIVQIGPWPRGQRPDDGTLSIAFHYNGKKQAEYSTLDIAAGDRSNASCSVSHYTVIAEIEGFDNFFGLGEPEFALTTVDGRRLTFNALTGELLKTEKAARDSDGPGSCYDGE